MLDEKLRTENIFDFQELLKGLKDARYQDYLVFEYQASPPEGAAKAGLDYIRSLLTA